MNIEAILKAFKAGDDVDVDALTVEDRWELARRMGWTSRFPASYLNDWCGGPAPTHPTKDDADFEGAILSRQEADASRWG